MIDAGAQPSWRPKGIVAVLDTSIHVRAWLSPRDRPNPSLRIGLLAGIIYDSVTSPAVLGEVEEVLTRPRFAGTLASVRVWLDSSCALVARSSRRLFLRMMPVSLAATSTIYLSYGRRMPLLRRANWRMFWPRRGRMAGGSSCRRTFTTLCPDGMYTAGR